MTDTQQTEVTTDVTTETTETTAEVIVTDAPVDTAETTAETDVVVETEAPVVTDTPAADVTVDTETAAATDAPVVEEAPVTDAEVDTDVVVNDTEETTSVDLDKAEEVVSVGIFDITPDDSFIIKLLKENLKRYVEVMGPTNVSPETVKVRMQLTLKNVIEQAIKVRGSEFATTLQYLLSVFHEYRNTVFSDRYLYRFFDSMGMDGDTRVNYEHMLSLFTCVADPRARVSYGQQVDIGRLLRGYSHDEEFKQLLLEFLGRGV